jgi:hypothetical protein
MEVRGLVLVPMSRCIAEQTYGERCDAVPCGSARAGLASPEPPKQKTTYLLYWRKPEEWGQLIYD